MSNWQILKENFVKELKTDEKFNFNEIIFLILKLSFFKQDRVVNISGSKMVNFCRIEADLT